MSLHPMLPIRGIAGVIAVGWFLGAAAGGTAQESAPAAKRISNVEAQTERLSGQMENISAEMGETRVAQLFGESDEEKAARLQKEQAQDSSIAALNQRVSDLEETLRRLTGQMEELDHRVGEFNEHLSRVRKEFDYKICALAAAQLGASTVSGEDSALPCTGSQSGTTTPNTGGSPPAGNPGHLAPPPGVLGTLPRDELPQQTQALPGQTGSIDTRPQFEAALTMLAKAQYDEARAAFRGFADNYPKDELASQAVYWVGDIAFVQKDYPTAARAFAEELKKYSDSPRAPDSMLKLGQSLLALNQKKEGCRALATLPNQYPAASKLIADQALSARKAAGCR